MNFVAVLAVLAATSFALPLLVQAGEAAGLGRGASVVASLVLALLAALLLLARAALAARRRPAGHGTRVPTRRPRQAPPAGAARASAATLADSQPQALRPNLRLMEAEEESRAGL